MEDYIRRNWDNCKRGPGEDVCHKGYHYTDAAFQHDHYDRAYAGTSDHDIVSTINAAIAVLKGDKSLLPFTIKDKTEALLLLSHLVGDLHQPLHVVAVYLDVNDKPFDADLPDPMHDLSTETQGGNSIVVGASNLHSEWDQIPNSMDPNNVNPQTITVAKSVPVMSVPPIYWAEAWATETVMASKAALDGITYSLSGTKDK